ncbi:MAG: hypothetical protein UX04_C0001G0068 [Microgenomates group bacterium GW2011_GWF2_45_18]|nr:MAG: hypothetical protein UW18_C0003G0163 [Microgenomates group bacterium GW2011_GWF1_44_10]KKU02297.1 MAG: hypothetical protein UX04_C0001G0068 [Microgenomates group bacterium GW2011_GWF2_45_18]OGJ41634.1 MAG: hypothetical protein A2378_01980 [Candidatus Pacebacteria bacterium RIFOXYB1_FULL_44_10]HAU99237.1 hypothetical protein [Candidatus Paceibacterota bacterium]HAX01768.1 hypothetical protein [Candidatus Paceibacterota bacterium]
MRKLLIVAGMVVLWRVFLQSGEFLGQYLGEYHPSFPYVEVISTYGPRSVNAWSGFDGVHYLSIATNGYFGTGLVQAFFPLFPLLLKVAVGLSINPVIFGQVMSLMFFIVGLTILLKYTEMDHSLINLVPILVFPTAFFFAAVYTESLFFLLMVSAFYLVKKENWLLAGLILALGSATRLVGVFGILAALSVPWLSLAKRHFHSLFSSSKKIAIGFLGIGSYMAYLWYRYQDPLLFFHVQADFNAGRQESLILFPQVVYRYLNMIWNASSFSWAMYATIQEFVITMGVLCILLFMTFTKRYRTSIEYLLFSWFCFLLPPLTGTFQSMPRYVLTVFPIFFFFARLRVTHPKIWVGTIIAMIPFLFLNTALFLHGVWVA